MGKLIEYLVSNETERKQRLRIALKSCCTPVSQRPKRSSRSSRSKTMNVNYAQLGLKLQAIQPIPKNGLLSAKRITLGRCSGLGRCWVAPLCLIVGSSLWVDGSFSTRNYVEVLAMRGPDFVSQQPGACDSYDHCCRLAGVALGILVARRLPFSNPLPSYSVCPCSLRPTYSPWDGSRSSVVVVSWLAGFRSAKRRHDGSSDCQGRCSF